MYNYVARQPILDSNHQLKGYELLFRDGKSNRFPDINHHEATSRLLANSHFLLGLDNITGAHPAYINFPEISLLVKVPEFLPKDQVVIEVLEDIASTQPVVAAFKTLKDKGYRIALDDFNPDSKWQPLIPYVDVVKLDFMQTPRLKLLKIANELKQYGVELLAEKVETYDDFEFGKRLGCTQFQGYYFSKPEIMKGKALTPGQNNLLLLLSKTMDAHVDLNEIEGIVQNDVSLTYKLLRYVNSPAFAKSRKIASIKQALAYLGEVEFRKFLALMVAANLSDQKPAELIQLSVSRARFCELLAEQLSPDNTAKAFLTGLFSLIGAILDTPTELVMEKLPLAPEIQKALIENEGELSIYLMLIQEYEQARWNKVSELAGKLNLDFDQIPQFYFSALKWAKDFAGG